MPKTFLEVAQEFIAEEEPAAATRKQREHVLARLLPIHRTPIDTLTQAEAFTALKVIQQAGHRSTAHRAMQMIGRTLKWAICNGYRPENSNFVPAMHRVLKTGKVRHRPALTKPEDVGAALRAISSYRGSTGVSAALRLLPHVFLRPGELRAATWSEINFARAEWLVPAERTKMRRPHVVPLSRQAIGILRELEATGDDFGPWVFPGVRAECLAENAIAHALVEVGVPRDRHVPHGWRTTASTILNERGWDPALIELQLGHAKRDRIAAIYDRSQRLPERAAMMQAWSDMLDEMRDGAAA